MSPTSIIFPKSTVTPQRLLHLDSLRGIAALGVAFHHCCYSFSGIPHNEYLYYLTGESPVVFFFLLSGFVLSRSFFREDTLSLPGILGFYIRRIFRIYPAMLASIVFALAASFFYFLPNSIYSSTPWLHSIIFKAQAMKSTLGYFQSFSLLNTDINPPLWTIRMELFGSFLLPLLALLLRRFPRLAMVVGLLIILFSYRENGHPRYYIAPLFAFYLGYLLHLAEPFLKNITSKATKWLMFFSVILLLFSLEEGFNYITHTIILAGILSLLIPCNSPRIKTALESNPLLFLGKISYSFYLLSLPIILLIYSFLAYRTPGFLTSQPNLIPAVVLFFLSLIPTILLASLFERFIERSGSQVGSRLAKRWAR